jgi:hypothetical protein
MENLNQKYHHFCSKFWLALPISFVMGSGIAYGKLRLFHLICLAGIIDYIFNFRILKPEKWDVSFLLFVVWESLSFIWSADKALSLRYLFCIGNGIILIFLSRYYIEQTKFELAKILNLIFKFNFFMMCLALLEILGLFRWPLNLYSPIFYNHNISELLEIYKTDLAGLTYLKSLPSVFFWNSNDLCFYLISTLPFLFLTKIKKNWFKYFYVLILMVILIANTGRSTLLGVILFLATGVFFNTESKKFRGFLFALLVGLIFAIFFANELTFLSTSRQNRLKSFTGSMVVYSEIKVPSAVSKNLYVNSSTIKRFDYLRIALEQFKQHPFLGIGVGNLLVKHQDNLPNNVHNFWIEILTETGIVGFLLLINWLFSWLYRIRRIKEVRSVIYLSFLLLVPTALSVSSAVYQPGFWIPVLFLYFFQNIITQKE